jgi:hypothetical protein
MNERQYTLTDHELEIVMNALIDQPYKIVAGIVPKLVNQANAQSPGANAQAAISPPAAPPPAAAAVVGDVTHAAQNVVHDALASVEGALAGTKLLS